MKAQRIHCPQHVPVQGLGSIENWIRDQEYQLTFTRFFENDYQPSRLNPFDWFIVMGSPLGVDDGTYPWFKVEKDFLKEAITANKVGLRICLGSQLIASALGCKTFRNRHKRITPHSLQGMLKAGESELIKNTYIQNKQETLTDQDTMKNNNLLLILSFNKLEGRTFAND
ncbi:glutamine amidotransferase-related protein [Sunxiuqinia sp. sy24]|uniref:glutamine amidotransferase-related protein n=1 Tax=Sunxiuqinia sp. sy24 TaxID=3461495 RepID=UPI0040464963